VETAFGKKIDPEILSQSIIRFLISEALCFLKGTRTMSNGILPDNGAFIFTLPSVVYGFLADTRNFWGGQALGSLGSASITTQMDDLGNVVSGRVLVIGGVPPKNIPDRSLLAEGEVTAALVTPQMPFWVSFLFKLTHSHPNLGYKSPVGVWNAYFEIRGWTVADAGNIFKKGWGPDGAPLNTNIGQVKSLF
jgi:hypothetical protein